jgi:NlpC/P60 family putative phage cell wall peptidase
VSAKIWKLFELSGVSGHSRRRLAGQRAPQRRAKHWREPKVMSVVVEAARAWLGTPYVHQASVKGSGCDCLGLVRGIWREVVGQEPVKVPPYSPDWDEYTTQDRLARAAGEYFERCKGPLAAGDVLLFRMRAGAVAKHLGVVSETGTGAAFIHAYAGHGVVESPLSAPWQRRISGRFAFKF